MCQCKLWEFSVVFACFSVYTVTTFNVDSFNYAFYDVPDTSAMFGFSIALHKEGGRGWLIVGAPEAQSTYQRGVFRGGVVYKCPTARDGNCEEIPFDTKHHVFDQQTGLQVDNKTEQWFGATVSSSGRPEGPIVACAPRYTWYPVKMQRRDPVGTCYVSNGLFDQFNEYSPCRTFQWGYHRQGLCQAGFSAAINSIGDRLFIGAPGSWYSQGQMYSVDAHATFEFKPLLFSATYGAKGQVHQQSLETRPAVFSTKSGPPRDDVSYMGYSTIVGDFLGNGEEGIAVGMPRGNDLLGRVLLFTWNLTDYRHFTGEQLGGYFGYALAACDVDGDTFLDLIVGAPMYTPPNNKDQYDVGRVYVYYHKNGTQKGTFNWKYVIDGFNTKSRFGQALASLGDINQDGYDDFAVGAPYDGKDNRGAVYIYHGSSKGVRKKYSQVIFAEDVIPNPTALATFGFSITGGLDLDGNQYPDMAVGAYLSNKAFFFRSRPVIRVDAYVRFLTENKEVDLEKTDLILANNTRAVKTQIEFCSKYYGKGIPSSIDLDLQYILDSKKPLNPRMGFLDNEGNNIKNATIKLYRNQTKCTESPIDVYVRSNIRDKLTPLVAEVKYWMSVDQDLYRDSFLQIQRNPRSTLIPVLDLNSPPSKKDSIRIQTNCGSDDVCIPDLKLIVKPRTTKYFFNSKERIELEIFVSNDGEASFETTVEVKYPESLYYGNSIDERNDTHVLCSDFDNYTVKCDIGNPLPHNKGVPFRLWWKPNYEYDNLTAGYAFEVSVNSTNPEKEYTVHDNKRNITIEILSEHHQEIYQQSIPADVFFNSALYTADISQQSQKTSQADRLPEEVIGPQVIHIYRLKNEGQITIKKTEIFFVWPARTFSGDDFFYLVEPPHFSGTDKMNIQCGPNPANYRDFEVLGNRNKSIWERFHIDINGPNADGQIWTTTPPPTTPEIPVGSEVGGLPAQNNSAINKIVEGPGDVSRTLEVRKARRVEIFWTGSSQDYLAHTIPNTQYSYRCLEPRDGVIKEVECGAEFGKIVDSAMSLVREGQVQLAGAQRQCVAIIQGKVEYIECGGNYQTMSTVKVQIFQTPDGNYLRQRLGNTGYYYSCVQSTDGTSKEVKCGPEMAATIQRIARLVEEGTIRVGGVRHCMETVNGQWQVVDCDGGGSVGGGDAMAMKRVQIIRGQVGMLGEKHQLQRIGNSQYYCRCMKAVNGREEEVNCGPEYSSTIASISRFLESGSSQLTESLDGQCMQYSDGHLKTVDCGSFSSGRNLGKVEIFQGQGGHIGGKYENQQLGTTKYFYRCLRTRNGREEEVECGPEFESTIENMLRLIQQGDLELLANIDRKCMRLQNGKLTPAPCDTPGGQAKAVRFEIFLGRSSSIRAKNQRLGNTEYYYRCWRTINGQEVEETCGPEFSATIAEMTRRAEKGTLCMREENGRLVEVDCDSRPDVPDVKKIRRVEIFMGRDSSIRAKYQRLGNTEYYYRCLTTVNGQEHEVFCGSEFSETIAHMTRLAEEGTLFLTGNIRRKCMKEENGRLVEIDCNSFTNVPDVKKVGRVEIFMGRDSSIRAKYQRLGNTEYYYRCLTTVNGQEIEETCGPEFSATIAEMARRAEEGTLFLSGSISRKCMRDENGRLVEIDCNSLTNVPDVKKVGRVEIFMGRDSSIRAKYQRLGNTEYYYRCLQTVNGQEHEVFCGSEFSETIAHMTKLAEEGSLFLNGNFERKCMKEVNRQLVPTPCDDITHQPINIPGGKVQLFHGDLGGDQYVHQRIANSDYFYRCMQNINGVDREVPCGTQFMSAVRNISVLLQRGSYPYGNRECMQFDNGKLESVNCATIFSHLHSTTEPTLRYTHKCWIYDNNWRMIDCSSSELSRTHAADGKQIHRRCFRSEGTDVAEKEISCDEVIKFYQRWGQSSHFEGGYEETQDFGATTQGRNNYDYGQGYQGSYNSSYSRTYQIPNSNYGGSSTGSQYTGLERAALGTGGFHTQFLDVGDVGSRTERSHWSDNQPITEADNFVGRDNVPTDRPVKRKNWHGRKKRQIVQDNNPSIIEIRTRFPCQSMDCEYMRCTVENLEHNRELVIALRGRLNARVLRNISLAEPMSFTTLMAARVVESPVPGSITDKDLVYQEAMTTVKTSEAELKSDIVPLWVVVLSAVAGTIILLLLVFLLYKMGFFKRNRPSSAPERQPLNRNGYHHGDEVL